MHQDNKNTNGSSLHAYYSNAGDVEEKSDQTISEFQKKLDSSHPVIKLTLGSEKIMKAIPQPIQNLLIKHLEDDLKTPVKILGIGKAGVGKTELVKSIFSYYNEHKPSETELIVSNIHTGTKDFERIIIQSPLGGQILITDSPGLGEGREKDKVLLTNIINEIKNHDLVYWVFDVIYLEEQKEISPKL